MTWRQAQAAAQALQGSGYRGSEGWRLPNHKELASLVRFDVADQFIDGSVFPAQLREPHWTSTFLRERAGSLFNPGALSEATGKVYTVHGVNGDFDFLSMQQTAPVRLVRDVSGYDRMSGPFTVVTRVQPAGGGSLNCQVRQGAAQQQGQVRCELQGIAPNLRLQRLIDDGVDRTFAVVNGVYVAPIDSSRVVEAVLINATQVQLDVPPPPHVFLRTAPFLFRARVLTEQGTPANSGTVTFSMPRPNGGLFSSAPIPVSQGEAVWPASLFANVPMDRVQVRAQYSGFGELAPAETQATYRFMEGAENRRMLLMDVPTALAGSGTGGSPWFQILLGSAPAGCVLVDAGLYERSAVSEPAPSGLSFPKGLLDLKVDQCPAGSSVTLSLVYPTALPVNATYWKYGPTPDRPVAHWYPMPAGSYVVDGNTVRLTLTDGAIGDDDLTRNGRIVDIGGPVVMAGGGGGAGDPVAIPVFGSLGQAVTVSLVALLGLRSRNRWRLSPDEQKADHKHKRG